MRPEQANGPDWLKGQRFHILAKLPAGATKMEVPEMLRAMPEESQAHSRADARITSRRAMGHDAGSRHKRNCPDGIASIGMTQLAQVFAGFLGRPVTDMTGLQWTYLGFPEDFRGASDR